MFRGISEKLLIHTCVPENFSGTHVFLSLGSNLGDRKEYLQKAIFLLEENGCPLLRVSSCYETTPVGCEEGAGAFLNIAVEGVWQKDALSLLKLCQKIETELGRPSLHAHWVSRVVDIDIIFFGDDIIALPELSIPHPLAKERRFVMEPLAEIAAERLFPGTEKSCYQIFCALV